MAQQCFPELQWKETSKSAPTRMNPIVNMRNKAHEKMGRSQMQTENCDRMATRSRELRLIMELHSKFSKFTFEVIQREHDIIMTLRGICILKPHS